MQREHPFCQNQLHLLEPPLKKAIEVAAAVTNIFFRFFIKRSFKLFYFYDKRPRVQIKMSDNGDKKVTSVRLISLNVGEY